MAWLIPYWQVFTEISDQKPGTDQKVVRNWFMGIRNKNLIDIFSYTTIVVSVALISGLALGRATEKSMHQRLSADIPSDPVERYGLGQNAYQTTPVNVKPVRAASPEYTDARYEMGKYVNGARVLVPFEPARKSERVRLERLEAWNDENFDTNADTDDDEFGYAVIDVGNPRQLDNSVDEDFPPSAVMHAVSHDPFDDSEFDPVRVMKGEQQTMVQEATKNKHVSTHN